jgi:PPOX class probable F420-dependent enzyme
MIPDSHHDLLADERRAMAFLATLMPDGSPQLTPVWFDYQEGKVRINTARGRVKEKNMTARPQVALVIHDPQDTYRYIQLRGEATGAIEEGAAEHINRMSYKYDGQPFRTLAPNEVRVIFEIEPHSVSVGN